MDEEVFPTPEEAALATWADVPSAKPRVLRTSIRGDWADVVIETDPSYPDRVGCQRVAGGWIASSSQPD